MEVYPENVDLASDLAFGSIEIDVAVFATSAYAVCPGTSSRDIVASHTSQVDAFTWRVWFDVDPDLSVGEHRGVLEVYTSSDETCRSRSGPSRRIPYRLRRVYGFGWNEAVSLRATSATTADALRGSARIDMADGPQHAWTARSYVPWLVVDTPSGLTGSDVRFHVDPAHLSALENGATTEGAIDIAGDEEGMTGRSVPVSLELALADARSAMPAAQPAGVAPRVRVHGLGFMDDSAVLAHLAVQGVPGAVFTRLGDADVVVQLPASDAGTYTVVATNALGVPTGSAAFRLTAPLETARAVLPGDGANGWMLWDAGRDALLVLEPSVTFGGTGSSTLRRHALRQGVWTTSGQGVDMLRRMALSPDGSQLVAHSESGWIYVRDPETLDIVDRYGTLSAYLPEPPLKAPLAVTVDGRVWLPAAGGMLTFGLGDHQQQVVPSSTWGVDGFVPQGTLASRDGGRLLVSPEDGGPFVFVDVADGTAHVNAAGLSTFDAISDTGDRVLAGEDVYDWSFGHLGRLPGPGVLSGDGRRAFTLEARCDWQIGGPAPRLHVFDLTAPAAGGGLLPELGTVDLLDHSACTAGEPTCAPTSGLTATPDGRVVFVQTAGGVVVVPIPESLIVP
jgi:hypothetical protein